MHEGDEVAARQGGDHDENRADAETQIDHERADQHRKKSGWMAWTPAGGTHLLDEVRTEIERRVGLAQNERGALLAVVEVRVFENTSEAQVSVPSEALLRPDHDRDVIADVVRRAQEELGNWR
jgi:hypothetical protein